MTIKARRYRVTGRVQGVFYRATTQRRAQQLGLTGYAKNRVDGSVEVLAQGPVESLEQLEAFLWEGSHMSRVDDVAGRGATVDETRTEFTTG